MIIDHPTFEKLTQMNESKYYKIHPKWLSVFQEIYLPTFTELGVGVIFPSLFQVDKTG